MSYHFKMILLFLSPSFSDNELQLLSHMKERKFPNEVLPPVLASAKASVYQEKAIFCRKWLWIEFSWQFSKQILDTWNYFPFKNIKTNIKPRACSKSLAGKLLFTFSTRNCDKICTYILTLQLCFTIEYYWYY